jgi:hypothetical protein
MPAPDPDQLCVNTIRTLSMDPRLGALYRTAKDQLARNA